MNKYRSSLSKYMESYEAWMIPAGRWVESTERFIRDFDKFCYKQEQKSRNLQSIVDDWFKKKSTEKINSCRTRIYPVIAFLKYTNSHAYTNIIIPLPPRKQKCTYIPHAFTAEELKLFFYYADRLTFSNRNVFNARCDGITVPVFFRLLYSTGLRTCEARWLKRSDVDLKHGIINVEKSKCSVEHYVVMHDSLTEVMARYDQKMDELIPQRKYFFPGRNDQCLTCEWVDMNFRKIRKKVGCNDANPYCFRHNYAITNINNWINNEYEFFDKFVYLSKSMGHVTLESTKYYYSLVPGFAEIIESLSEDEMSTTIPEVKEDENK